MDGLKTWLLNNIKWIIGMTAILLMNFFILKAQVDENTRVLTKKLGKDEAKVYIDQTIKNVFTKELEHYFTDTKGQLLQQSVDNLQRQIDRLEILLNKN